MPQSQEDARRAPKDAHPSVVAANASMRAALPFHDRQDFDDARRGFIDTLPDAVIVNQKRAGAVVWTLEPYGFLTASEAPETVNPSLWRQSQLNMNHGLFEVCPRVYQIRGFDLANMTLIEGDTGVIVVDTLTSAEGARAGLDLYYKHRGQRPVTAIIYTHTHADHWGGASGVIGSADKNVPIIAPNLFMEYAVSENIIAGNAMIRRGQYQFGPLLRRGPCGQIDCGLGKSLAAGTVQLIAPNDLIMATGDTRMIDGLQFDFQMAPESEAPAEMHFYVPLLKMLNLAENATHNFHNLLPFRGSEVRNAHAWSGYLNEALRLWGSKAEVLTGQHHWPVWGNANVKTRIKQQRDLYKFAHDQTLRLINHGLTASEISEVIRLPQSLENAWHARGYYGHIRHNVKAIYQRTLGWYDANPAHLDPLPPIQLGQQLVRYMGGAQAVLSNARADFEAGNFRVVSEVLNHLVFAEADNEEARLLLADAYEQLGYASESAAWRNAYLFAAQELRHGMPKLMPRSAMSLETAGALRVEQLFDYLGVCLNGSQAEGKIIVLALELTDVDESYVLNLENSALTYFKGKPNSDVHATVTLDRTALNELVLGSVDLAALVASGRAKTRGKAERVDELMALRDAFERMFEIVAPNPKSQDCF